MDCNKLICCPTCKQCLTENYSKNTGHLYSYSCEACGRVYPFIDGIIEFLPHIVEEKSLAQQAMESQTMVSIYESTLWRASYFFSLFTRIKLEDEISLIKNILHINHIETVLDLACGPGLYGRNFSNENKNCKIIGLDLSWPMLKLGAKKANAVGIENIQFIHGDAHYLPLNEESMDAVNCCGALHIFPDIPRALDEIHRVTKPGGCFSAAVLLRGSSILREMHAYFAQTIGGIHFFQMDEFKDLLDKAGFEPAVYHAKSMWMIAGGIRRS